MIREGPLKTRDVNEVCKLASGFQGLEPLPPGLLWAGEQGFSLGSPCWSPPPPPRL